MSTEKYPEPLQLDIKAILRKRAPRIPTFISSLLARLVHQKDLNQLLAQAYPAAGTDFCHSILHQLHINIEIKGQENIPHTGKHVFASNHPLGGLDGITLIAVLGSFYSDENIIFPVNDMLMNVRPLQNIFTPVNKYGKQGRQRISGIRQAFQSNKHVIIFPAGLVSRKRKEGIQDLEWQKSFLTQAANTNRTIIPIKFEAQNRMSFYRLAQWRKRLRIPINIEQAWLPTELVHCRHKTFRLTFLPPIDAYTYLSTHTNPRAAAAAIRQTIYQ